MLASLQTIKMNLKKWLIAGAIIALGGVAFGLQQWFKPHAAIGAPTIFTTANAVVHEFEADEAEATKKYVSANNSLLITEVSGKISEVVSDTSGVTIALETENPIKGVRCTLDKFTKAPDRKFVVGDSIALKGLCTGFLSDVIFDRCVFVR